MSYRNLLTMVLLIWLVLSADVTGRTKPRQRKRHEARYKDRRKVEFDLCYDFLVAGKTPRIKFVVLLPRSIPLRQRIYRIEYSSEPARVFNKNGNDYAEFIFTDPPKQFTLQINIKAGLFRYDLSVARELYKTPPPKDPNLGDFLVDEKYIQKSDPVIQEIAKKIKAETEVRIVKKIHNYVINTMDYVRYEEEMGAVCAAKERKGDCSEYSALFVALCRAKNIPARVVSGYTTETVESTTGHAWVEVYLRRYGWVPFDPTWADIKRKSAWQFHYLPSVYLYYTKIRKDNVVKYRYGWWHSGDKIKIEDSFKVVN